MHRADFVSPDRTMRSADLPILILLVIVGAGLRFYRLGTGLWYDEIVTVLDSVRLPLSEIVTHFPSNNDHPLYSVLAHLCVVVFGEQPWALRLPSALFGIATIPMLYFVGTSVSDRGEARAATIILAVSYHHIWFSQNARGYTALLFLVLLSTFALVRWFDTGRRSFLMSYAVITGIGAYAHLTMVPVCLSHALACFLDWLVQGRTSRVRVEWSALAIAFLGAGVLTVFFYAPMLLDVSSFFTTKTAAENEVATPVWAMLAALSGLRVGFGTVWVIALGAVIFGAGAWSYFKERPTVFFLFLLPLPVTVLLAIAMNRPIFPRFVFFATGLVLLVAVRGASYVGALMARMMAGRFIEHTQTLMLVLTTVGAVAFSIRSLPYGYRYPKQDYEQAVAFVEQAKGETDIAAAIGETGATPIVQYLGRSWPRVDDEGQWRDLRENGKRVWVVFTFPSYIEAGQPGLWKVLQDECVDISEFEGTVAGGAITVRRCP